MRLLSANSLQLHQFNDEGRLPPYAILSHTWGDQEVSLSDLESDNISLKSGFRKIEQACKQALIDGLEFVWVDTCCIDKGSSAELSEAINSMFRWYECASACYAYLEDVHWQPVDFECLGQFQSRKILEGLKGSRWFARGWTLQELIAPNEVYFYNSEWKTIGTRTELCSCIEEITSINQDVLTAHHRNLGHGTIGPLLASKSVAQRMAWAANRETTRPEDMAYSLLGLFDIHMPLIYGEGVNKAFTRLQAEILRDSADHSILAWSTESHISTITVDQPQSTPGGPIDPRDHVAVALATQPKLFALCKNIATILASDARPIEMTSRGLKIDLRLIPEYTQRNVDYFYAALACHEEDDFATYGGIPLLQYHGEHDKFFRDPRRPLVKIPIVSAERVPLRTIYIATKANVYPTSDAIKHVVPQHFLLRHSAHDGLQHCEVHAQPVERWNHATHTMQFRGIPVRTAARDSGDAFSFAVGFGVSLNSNSEKLSKSSEIYRPYVRLFHTVGSRLAVLDDDEWSGGVSDTLYFREHMLRASVEREVLFAKPVFVVQFVLRSRPLASPENIIQ